MASREGVGALVDWLIDGAEGAARPEAIVTRLGEGLRAAGVPVERVAAYVTTLHPSVVGRSFRWSPETGTVIGEALREIPQETRVMNSPVGDVIEKKIPIRIRLRDGAAPKEHPVVTELRDKGLTDYAAFPMFFTSGETQVITFATKHPDGFSDADYDACRQIVRPLSRIAEIFALRRNAVTLLSTYLGRNSGAQVLGGRILKGDFETLRAVIWFSDLRGFTALTARSTTREVIDTLNRVFDCQVPAIERHGGEVLKFMGDGLLAIFPLAEKDDPARMAEAALEAADDAFAAIDALAPLQIGLALHVGELAYGNIGGSNRLDFTAIGPAVNITARLESLTSKLGRRIVLSEDLARLTTRATEALGAFELKGVPEPTRVFGLRAG